MADIVEFPVLEPKADFLIGPFEYWPVVLDGVMIPNLTGQRVDQDLVNLIVDGRFCVCLPEDRARDVAWLVAHAMAVSAGYTHFGAQEKGRPFATKVLEVTSQ
ncbi:MAG TPA: hypothetical protein VGV37_06495 [Aliidongia sp.]|uniref:hypothetical protein n=1 Tax=Aliidongia sp. TaxID=1914230 RepID=UPI002DDD05DA|nr:hypothetical protein [Aliidongia sp.]HEV2674175.1 hypothetical protein [Aliidongia sp.]